MRKCLTCKKDISKRHTNAKRCEKCARNLRHRPVHNLTISQQRRALRLAGTMYRDEIAKEMGVSRSQINRFARENKHVNWNHLKYSDETVEKVIDYYLTHSRSETEKKFSNVRVRSIVERYLNKDQQKCKKWTDDDIVKLHKWTGLVQWQVISKKLDKNTWAARRKRYRIISGRINSLPHNIAKNLTKVGCPYYYVRLNNRSTGIWIATWVGIEKHLKDDLPAWIKDAIKALSKFQIWLHGSRKNIQKILEEKL